MTELIFVDANVLVYNRDASEPAKQERAHAWIEGIWETGNGRISFQVLVEFYVIVTAKLKPGMDPEEAQAEVRELTRSASSPGVNAHRLTFRFLSSANRSSREALSRPHRAASLKPGYSWLSRASNASWRSVQWRMPQPVTLFSKDASATF